ncbi:MAG: hypothetical protein AYK18_06455 [Theionarchaea archaeon DG-70]|nr:MAG: hypothetical protein AYK18_06455 [Theionarchaea archaeon DG-70]
MSHPKLAQIMFTYHSKLAQIMFTYELARRLEGTGVTVNCIRVTNVKIDLEHDCMIMTYHDCMIEKSLIFKIFNLSLIYHDRKFFDLQYISNT